MRGGRGGKVGGNWDGARGLTWTRAAAGDSVRVDWRRFVELEATRGAVEERNKAVNTRIYTANRCKIFIYIENRS